jgi:hypothetical protein
MASNLSQDSRPAAQQPRQSQPPQPPQSPQARSPQAQYVPPPAPQARQQPADQGIWPLIRQSAARLSRNEDAFIKQLHFDVARLTQDRAGRPAPETRGFCERMARSLLWVALTDQPLTVVVDTLRQVGAQNWTEGFGEAHYENFAHALVQTVHYLSDIDWSATAGSTWITYFMWVKPHLLAGAQYAASQVVADVNRESEADLLDDEDDEDPGYGQIMLGMTRPRRDPHR